MNGRSDAKIKLLYLVFAKSNGEWELLSVKAGHNAAGREVTNLKSYGYDTFKIMECEVVSYLVPKNVESIEKQT